MSIHTLEIEALANGGDGVAHLQDGRVVFVPLTAPGDTAEVELKEDRASYCRGTVSRLLEPSADRVEPPCPYYGVCGGCNWQHLPRDVQLTTKTQFVTDALARIGHLESHLTDSIPPTLGPSDAYGYRNKVELRVDNSGPKLQLGFTRRDSDEIVPVDECLLMPERNRSLIASVRGALRFIAGRERVQIERVAIRCAHNTKDVQIALWTLPSAFPRSIAGTTLQQATGAGSVVRVIADDSSSKRAVKNVERLAGKAWWSERLGGSKLSASAPSFFQVNTVAAETLIETALAAADVSEEDFVLDLYAGVGTFTLPLAERSSVVAVESSRWALNDLRHNLERAEVHADVIGGDASYALDDIVGCDVALVDPPRSGLAQEALDGIARLEPRRVVYVSCDAATFARDAGRLATSGYALTSARPVDLFPSTHHTELVGSFDAE
jgi:23S rRNA (uracil1939-C5)-methyltransferase